ncbi:metallophosphoesterase family protein [Pseudophaeobacter flagellatus]|uniref:metallophosphoesterase family protein n=1 Tax=Pseudophaeobacter flagellatus TaxID=2899119 RepID=UPI001E3CB7B6|nr:metallophosphoesterase [Pseudophaeobacter flagellatus]MCD9148841.1 metallophosphoesterase [Pseudophaeobacter flagellatus]
MSVRLAIVSDIHHGTPSATKRGDTAMGLMDEFSHYVRDANVDQVLDLGDRISDVDHDTDLRLEAEVAEAFRAVEKPIWHLNGNHDRDHLSVAENEQILGQSLGHETQDIGGWRIALWRADTRILRTPEHSGFVLREADLLWLSRTVQAADRPLLVVSHVPVSGHSQIGNYYFQNNPGYSTYPMADRARAALAQARVPVVCLSGHVHWNTVTTVDGIPHLTQQSLTESFTTQGSPAGAMGVIELGETVRWDVVGEDPYRAEITPSVRRWTPVMPDFRDHPEQRTHTPKTES